MNISKDVIMEELDNMRAIISDGCHDGNCEFSERKGGQHTNGGCNCRREVKLLLHRLHEAIGRRVW